MLLKHRSGSGAFLLIVGRTSFTPYTNYPKQMVLFYVKVEQRVYSTDRAGFNFVDILTK